MSLTKGESKRTAPYINVTPLIDVLLVLLIIFMVISPAKPFRFETKIPERPRPGQGENSSSLVVTVPKDGGGYRLNTQEARTLEELGLQLRRALDGRPSDLKAVFVKAPQALAYGQVVKVIDVIKAAQGGPIGLQIENLEQ